MTPISLAHKWISHQDGGCKVQNSIPGLTAGTYHEFLEWGGSIRGHEKESLADPGPSTALPTETGPIP